MKWIIWLCVLFIWCIEVEAEEEPKEIYAQSAVLMDADTGRVLFEKDGYTQKAMASTTKIMTCILALELSREDTIVTFSKYASEQPKVHLGAEEGEQFFMKDMLFSLMLESHNDTAVAIAETVSGSVEAFACKMNEKAKEIGCTDTYYITPNGLDAENEYGMHSTTAADLAKVMSYCIEDSPCKMEFLEITGTRNYEFSNLKGNKRYYCTNKNNYLMMNSDAISGKTGYTAKAGYCYVGAVETEGRTFVVSLLACGWPNHKTYKWQDMNEITAYAVKEYKNESFRTDVLLEEVEVVKGRTEELFQNQKISVFVLDKKEEILIGNQEEIEIQVQQISSVEAPIGIGEQLGSVVYLLHGEIVAEYPIVSTENVKRIDFSWIFSKIMELYLI